MPFHAAVLALLAFAPLDGPSLNDAVREYLLAGGPIERRRLETSMLARDDASPANLIHAIRSAQLWESEIAGTRDVALRLRNNPPTDYRVVIHVPNGYTTSKRWPLIIALHGAGSRPEEILQYMRSLLDERSNEFIIAAPEGFGSMHLRGDAAEVGRPRDLVNALRRRFRLDDRRVFLTGYSLGSHNAWLGGLLHADLWAGVMPLATPLQIVGGNLLFEELFPNLANTYTLFCWGAKDNIDTDGNVRSDGGNAAWNRQMSQIMRGLGIRRFVPIELENAGHLNVAPPAGALDDWLNQKRMRYPASVRHVFRLPEHSRAYWVRAVALQGEPLPDGELRIRYKPGEDPRVKQREHLIRHLGLIEASIEDQTITLRGRRTTAVELLLHDKLIDLDKPITIRRGSRKLFSGKIPRDRTVLLREAASDWDFDRFFSARVVVPVGGKVRFGYDE